MSKVEDIAYLTHWGRRILPDCRVWCLLKLNFTHPEFGCEYVTAQWDPALRGGSWVLCDAARTVIELDSQQVDVKWFVVL